MSTDRQAVSGGGAFGAGNRQRILHEYLADAGHITPSNAWEHIYRLLLWINPTIGLAHCYESDKCQPGKPWYPRSLAFHEWVSQRLGVLPTSLVDEIDHMFRSALPMLARLEGQAKLDEALHHLDNYTETAMPQPGDDPDLVELVADVLQVDLRSIPVQTARQLTEVLYLHFEAENKRKNLLGRGFEDALAALFRRIDGNDRWNTATRTLVDVVPGFLSQGGALGKDVEVDLALWETAGTERRILVSSKWSVRADRERQFDSDFNDYSKANAGLPFEYVLVTNEFDAARLNAACSRVRGNQHLFSYVVHVAPEAVQVVYGYRGSRIPPATRGAATLLDGHISSGRLISLEAWLGSLVNYG